MKTQAPFPSAPGWPARVVGVLLLLIGLVLAVGGLQLAVLGGSPYYVLAGVGLIVAGVLMARRSITGAWVYLGVFVATFVWALWESGLNGWALVPRLVGPSVLLVLVLLCAPMLT